ncbi:MAG: BamA/TamA family outer membrane protein [bacterium]
MRLRALVVAAFLLLAFAGPAAAQFGWFGKNKTQTRDYRFQSYETEHFRILFYPGGEVLAEFAGRSAEEYYARLAGDLGFELDFKVPLIVYLSPGQFSETNVILDVIEEGVGGFSELFKNRIVMPFTGSYADFHHIIGHELAHIFQFALFYRSRVASLLGAVDEFQIPLWVLEGHAEYTSGWVNVRSEVFMRDLVLNNRLVPLHQLHDGYGYLVYREGEAFYHYVEQKYGRRKVYEFLHTLKNRRNLEATFRRVFGVSVERFSEDWEKWLRVRYWPEVTWLERFDTLARRLTDHRRDGSVYNTAPALSPGGTRIAFISDRSEYADLYVMSALDGRVLKRLVRGERSGGFEAMHLLRPGVAWSPDERMLALVTTSAGRDNISLIDYATGRVRRRLALGLDAVSGPAFAPDGRNLVFAGVKNGFCDIYTVSAAGGEPVRLTFDGYEDRDPAFSPGGDSIVFVSDRPDPGGEWAPGGYALWLRDGAGRLTRLTGRGPQMGGPVFAADGRRILYTASDSAANIYVYSLDERRNVGRTRFAGEASHVSLSQDDRRLVFAYFEHVGWDVAIIHDPLDRIPPDTGGFAIAADTGRFRHDGLDFGRVRPVGFSVSPDYAVGAATWSTAGGAAGIVSISLSDMLGNHRFAIYADIYGDILNSDLTLQYWLLPYRVDWGFTLFQFRDMPIFIPDSLAVLRMNRGGQALAAYPFDKFSRVELGLTGYASDVAYINWYPALRGWYTDTSRWERVFYASPAYVFDNTYWTWQGPARGSRFRLGADLAFLSSREFYTLYADLRNYQRVARRAVFATRLLGVGGMGPDADHYYLGGQHVRGYRYWEFADRAGRVLTLAGVELRAPFIDRLSIAAPLPLELGGIRGVAFLDAGWVPGDTFRFWNSAQGRLEDIKLGAGAGIRIQISYFYLKFDWGYPLSATDDRGWKFYFGLGTEY